MLLLVNLESDSNSFIAINLLCIPDNLLEIFNIISSILLSYILVLSKSFLLSISLTISSIPVSFNAEILNTLVPSFSSNFLTSISIPFFSNKSDLYI